MGFLTENMKGKKAKKDVWVTSFFYKTVDRHTPVGTQTFVVCKLTPKDVTC